MLKMRIIFSLCKFAEKSLKNWHESLKREMFPVFSGKGLIFKGKMRIISRVNMMNVRVFVREEEK